MGFIIKEYNSDPEASREREAMLKYDESVIKRYRIKYSIPQQVRFGMLPYSALEEYERQKAEDLAMEEAEAMDIAEDQTVDAAPEEPKKNHTFWEDDDGDRENLSDDEYAKFLAENGIVLQQATDVVASMLNNVN